MWQIHGRVCAFLTSVSLSEGVTQLLKLLVQRRRPNFYNLCNYKVELEQCTAPIEYIREANFSFPSGHSSLSANAMVFLVWLGLGLLLANGTRAAIVATRSSATNWFRPSPFEMLQYKALLIVVIPLSWAFYVAATRLIDHWHHPADVVSGLLLGSTMSTIAYHLWFPPIFWAQHAPDIPWSLHLRQAATNQADGERPSGSMKDEATNV